MTYKFFFMKLGFPYLPGREVTPDKSVYRND